MVTAMPDLRSIAGLARESIVLLSLLVIAMIVLALYIKVARPWLDQRERISDRNAAALLAMKDIADGLATSVTESRRTAEQQARIATQQAETSKAQERTAGELTRMLARLEVCMPQPGGRDGRGG